ncbi:MAG TPA: ABC transporter permease [Gemmatimonadaceae bacterium]|nr:ABC transporter permease [Gemmatimonadaceae bacterium]
MNDSPPEIAEREREGFSGTMSPDVPRRSTSTTKTLSTAQRGFMRNSMVQLTLVRFREFIREPEAVFWTFIFPILLAAGLGIAFRQRGPDIVQVGIINTSRTAAIIESLKKDSTLVVQSFDDSAGAKALRTGKIAVLVVPTARPDSVGYIYDRSRGEAANARVIVDRAVQTGAGRVDPVRSSDTFVTEPGSRYIDFLIPGLLGMNLMGSSIWGIGFSIVTARSKKLLKRLMATPMSRSQYLASFLCSRLVFLILEIVTLLGFGHWAFGVPLRGSLVTLLLICLVAAISFGGLGLLSASRARTTEAVSGIMNFIMLPMWIFSGVFFSAANFPNAVQPFIRLLPLTAVNDALRLNMLEGASLVAVTPQILVIIVWGVVTFFAALKLFRWR